MDDSTQPAEPSRKIHRDHLEILFGYWRAKCNDQLIASGRLLRHAVVVGAIQEGCKTTNAGENVFGLRATSDLLELECEKAAFSRVVFVKMTMPERERRKCRAVVLRSD